MLSVLYFQWDFSVDSIRYDLAPGKDLLDAKVVFPHLAVTGVCLEKDYNMLAASCPRVNVIILTH